MKTKNIIVISAIILIFISIPFIVFKLTDNQTDGEKFQDEYKNYNNKLWKKENKAGVYLSLEIEKDNPMIYLNNKNLISSLKEGNKLVFLGYPQHNIVRSAVPILLEAASENGIEQIYYYDYGNIKNSKINTSQELYEKLLSTLNKDKITAPTLILIKDGKISSIHEGTVKTHTDYTKDLTIEETNELYKIYEKMMIELIMCTDNC